MADKKKWIQKADIKKGALTEQAKAAGMGVHEFAQEHKGDSGTTGKRARLALTFEKIGEKKKSGAKKVYPKQN